jgi:Holliday junction resolvase RusA-like endonuclease
MDIMTSKVNFGIVRVRVVGIPRPGGSKRAFVNPKTQRMVVMDDCKENRNWRSDVKAAYLAAGGPYFGAGALRVCFQFYFPRPKGHYGSGRNSERVRYGAPQRHIVKPDLTKLIRSTEDALTGVAWRDDNQICEQTCAKLYCEGSEQPGVLILIEPLADEKEIPGIASGEVSAETAGDD